MLSDNHLDELAHGASHFPDFPADSVVQFQRDSAGDAFQLHSFLAPFSLVFPFWATQAYCNPPDKAITKTNNLSVKAGSTNVTTNKGYVGVILLSTGNQGSPSSPSEWLLPAVVWAGKAQL